MIALESEKHVETIVSFFSWCTVIALAVKIVVISEVIMITNKKQAVDSREL